MVEEYGTLRRGSRLLQSAGSSFAFWAIMSMS